MVTPPKSIMLPSLALYFGVCGTAVAAVTGLFPSSSFTLSVEHGQLGEKSLGTVESPHASVHIVRRTFSTQYTTPTLPIVGRAETTVAPKIIGYTSTQGVFSPFNCLSGTYFAVSGYARCCLEAQTDCPVFTACESTSVLRNDQYDFTCSGTGSQTVCVTGTIFESGGDTDPKYYVSCWPTWTGGGWKATRSVPDSSSSNKEGEGPPTGGKLAGIIVGAVLGIAVLVAVGYFAAKFYGKLKKTLVVLEGQAPCSDRETGTDAGTSPGAVVSLPGAAVRRPSSVQSPLAGNGLMAQSDSLRHGSFRHGSLGAVSNASASGSKNGITTRLNGPWGEIPEFPGYQTDPHEMDIQRPAMAQSAIGNERVRTGYVDVQEKVV